MPSDDDVLKARLKTVGVSEYRFEMEVSAGRDSGTEWRIVDVGGSRSQRRESEMRISWSSILMSFLLNHSNVGAFLRRWCVTFWERAYMCIYSPSSGRFSGCHYFPGANIGFRSSSRRR